MKLLKHLWHDDCGAILSVEYMLIYTTLVTGIVAGLTSLRNAVLVELNETARAVVSLDQSYSISGIKGCGGSSGGSAVTDQPGQIQDPKFEPVKPIDISISIPNTP